MPARPTELATLHVPFEGVSSLQIVDLLGRPITLPPNLASLTAGDHLLDVGELAAGIYWLVVQSATESSTLRLVVVHPN